MKRRKLETSDDKPTTGRGAKKGDIRNPSGAGGWQKGQSGNPDGRPPGSANKVQLANVWSAWKKSLALPLLFSFLNFKIPETMAPYGKRELLTRAEDAEIRAYMFKGYFRALDFVRKIAGGMLAAEIERDLEDMVACYRESRIKDSEKIIDFVDRKREVKS